jgi:hypothetical protein
MDVSLPDQLTFHAYIIQAAALAFAEHFYLHRHRLLQQLKVDTQHIMNNEDGFVLMEANKGHGLLEPGHHFGDIPRYSRRQHE